MVDSRPSASGCAPSLLYWLGLLGNFICRLFGQPQRSQPLRLGALGVAFGVAFGHVVRLGRSTFSSRLGSRLPLLRPPELGFGLGALFGMMLLRIVGQRRTPRVGYLFSRPPRPCRRKWPLTISTAAAITTRLMELEDDGRGGVAHCLLLRAAPPAPSSSYVHKPTPASSSARTSAAILFGCNPPFSRGGLAVCVLDATR